MKRDDEIIPIEEVSAEVVPVEPMPLTEQEEQFCQLYVHGGLGFTGQHQKCYIEIFGKDTRRMDIVSRRFISKPHIAAHIQRMTGQEEAQVETIAVKLQITETLKQIMTEAATEKYEDKYGVTLSPAPLRAVAVSAAKALMDIYPIKHREEPRLSLDGNKGNITFNVIVPPKLNEQKEDK